MWKRVLVGVLLLAVLAEAFLTGGGFFAPALMLKAFKVPVSPETLFLGHVIAWLLLIITLVCALALRWVWIGRASGWVLSNLLGVWWIGIGVGLFLAFGITDNLVLDSLKGALILLASAKSRDLSSQEKF